ncbi:hypothetical protein FHS81_000023 [Pseudochelatococcus contaminans]|uniref:Uncharacterized protein n=1 Tax=Pseudochelatococcus contaminans TaxID=1538103 RepID=A0A7W5Z152_9HYPH|nr:hypothetical protein [Pseudochelatococcus contaminans]
MTISDAIRRDQTSTGCHAAPTVGRGDDSRGVRAPTAPKPIHGSGGGYPKTNIPEPTRGHAAEADDAPGAVRAAAAFCHDRLEDRLGGHLVDRDAAAGRRALNPDRGRDHNAAVPAQLPLHPQAGQQCLPAKSR